MRLKQSHPSVLSGETIHEKAIKHPQSGMLKPVSSNTKLGGLAKKFIRIARETNSERFLSLERDDRVVRAQRGEWLDFPAYSLSLTERRTCPSYCFHWRDCYGNNTGFGHRFDISDLSTFVGFLERDLKGLARRHPSGFIVRLHVLGDFNSVEYVEFWVGMLEKHPNLRIFGYTARIPEKDRIGDAILAYRESFFERFRIRFSNWDKGNFTALSLSTATAKQKLKSGEGIICPNLIVAKDGLPVIKNCMNCGLCWTMTEKAIIFPDH